jgi:hypothetical protein
VYFCKFYSPVALFHCQSKRWLTNTMENVKIVDDCWSLSFMSMRCSLGCIGFFFISLGLGKNCCILIPVEIIQRILVFWLKRNPCRLVELLMNSLKVWSEPKEETFYANHDLWKTSQIPQNFSKHTQNTTREFLYLNQERSVKISVYRKTVPSATYCHYVPLTIC